MTWITSAGREPRGRSDRAARPHPGRRFLQPLAVAAVFLLFAVLFFGMAMLDFKRVESLLLDGLRSKAFDAAQEVAQAAAANHRRLLRQDADDRGFDGRPPVQDPALSLQERLVAGLLKAAQQIDYEQSSQGLSQSALRETAAELDLQAIALYDERGDLVAATASLPDDIAPAAAALIAGPHEIAIHLLHALGQNGPPGYVAIRRPAGGGAVVLVLDHDRLDFRAWQTAIEAALAEFRWSGDLAYLVLEDAEGRIFARVGTAPADRIEQCLLAAASAADARGGSQQCVRIGAMKMLQISYPFAPEDKVLGTLRVGLDTRQSDRLLLHNRRHIFLWTTVMVLIGLLTMTALYHTQNRHVARLQALQERLQQSSRLASLGRLAASVAHEIRNPLNAISMAVQRMQREFAPEAEPKRANFQRLTGVLREEIGRLNDLVENVLGLARTARVDPRPGSPAELLERVAYLLGDEAKATGVRLETDGDRAAPMIFVDPARMEQALLNVVRNALQSVSAGGCVTLSWKAESRGRLRIQVRDTGRGIAEGEIDRIFDPFYTTRANGVGLGLAIAHEIVAAHGGEIEVTSREGGGTTVAVLLPTAPSGVVPDPEQPRRPRPEEPRHGPPRAGSTGGKESVPE